MTVLVAYARTPEGSAALRAGERIARERQSDVVAFDLGGTAEQRGRAAGASAEAVGLLDADVAVRWAARDERDPDAVGALLDMEQELDVEVIVVGVRRRSPVGKLLLGSNAQQIILEASAPVVVVKAAPHER